MNDQSSLSLSRSPPGQQRSTHTSVADTHTHTFTTPSPHTNRFLAQTHTCLLPYQQHHAEPGLPAEVEMARSGWCQPVHQERVHPHVSQHGGSGCCNNVLPGNTTQGPPTRLRPPHAVSWGSGKFKGKICLSHLSIPQVAGFYLSLWSPEHGSNSRPIGPQYSISGLQGNIISPT